MARTDSSGDARRIAVVVVGGGAAGLAAAIAAARAGARVSILERLPRPGKKILVTGGGRCNLGHSPLKAAAFTSTNPALVRSVLDRTDGAAILEFFRGLGLATRVEEGRVYPATNQAASVLRLLEREARALGVVVETGCEVIGLKPAGGGFEIAVTGGRSFAARVLILAAGGKSYPALGSNGSGYELARAFGHRIIPPVPSAVPLVIKDKLCHFLQGLKVRVRAEALVGGKTAAEAEGDLLFTAYGLSGTAILDISEPLSIALNRDGGQETAVAVDFVPYLSLDDLASELGRRSQTGWVESELAAGLLPEKLAALAPSFAPIDPAASGPRPRVLAAALKRKIFPVQGTRGWNEAEFTSGGVDAREVDETTLESKKRPRLFLAGEVLDVQGPRGGYNLAWAWASGLVAGAEAAHPAEAKP
ncbi:MAG: aminoacetone oxidase family FAD-binding enzyme [Candidatus Aminicenantes bacterium]|nr:aminoacetone oxidase family FAD-binding enzyme [Candidatus Aminicenantes bacterium]